ncbi:MAG: hypothetical protein N2170_04775 [Bacteroidia bacterium]|nr:hypothetical protein [Bacteroidia bacterium]
MALLCWLTDTLGGIRYEWRGAVQEEQRFCIRIRIQQADRPVWLVLQEALPGGGWQESRKVYVDRWDLPKDCSLCKEGGMPGQRIRFVLQGPTARGGQLVIYEGYPWGRPPTPPSVEIESSSPPRLRVYFADAGQYLLRCYNRFGEEVFTVPIEVSVSTEMRYELPERLRGLYLIRVQDAIIGKVIAEKPLRL